jgi:hypothetical protein
MNVDTDSAKNRMPGVVDQFSDRLWTTEFIKLLKHYLVPVLYGKSMRWGGQEPAFSAVVLSQCKMSDGTQVNKPLINQCIVHQGTNLKLPSLLKI